MNAPETSSGALDPLVPSTWRVAGPAPWICFLRVHSDETVSREAVRDFAERLRTSTDPVVRKLCDADTRTAHEHILLASTEPVLANAAGQAMRTIVRSGAAGQAAERELLALLHAHLEAHPVRGTQETSLPTSVGELLAPKEPVTAYAEPKNRRALAFQLIALFAVILLSLAMTYVLRM